MVAQKECAYAGSIGANPNVVLNKADRATEAERQIAGPFTRKVLEKRLGRPVGPIYEVSAFQRLEKKENGRDWGLLVGSLQLLVEESGRTLVRAAGQRGLQRLGEEILPVTLEERGALARPIEKSERRIAAMRETIAEAERSLREISYLFMAEEHRLSDLFLERREKFLKEILTAARAEANEEFRTIRRRHGPGFRREAMHTAQVVAANGVLPWLTKEQTEAEEEYRKVAGRFVNMGNDYLRKLSESKIPELARTPNALNSEKGFRMPSRFRFEQLINIAQPASPLRYLADVVLGLIGASSVIQKHASGFLEYLMEMNSTRVQSDLIERVEGSQSQLEAEFRKVLHQITRVAMVALERARAE